MPIWKKWTKIPTCPASAAPICGVRSEVAQRLLDPAAINRLFRSPPYVSRKLDVPPLCSSADHGGDRAAAEPKCVDRRMIFVPSSQAGSVAADQDVILYDIEREAAID